MLLPAAAPALAVVALSVLIVLALHVTEPQELSPLPTSGEAMRRFAEAGYSPLSAAANVAERHALAAAARLQTFGCFAIALGAAAYSGWRGFQSLRVRGWSNALWVGGVVAICLAPSVIHGPALPMLDYLVTSTAGPAGAGPGPRHDAFFLAEIYGVGGMNSRMSPAVFLVERGLLAAALASFFAVLLHDLGYRLREALEDFGVLETDEDLPRRRAPSGARAERGRSHGADSRDSARDQTAEGGGFGQRRGTPPRSAPPSDEARARAVLGVGMNASRREIERAYRSQMKRAHPDHGGSVERAAALNAARDRLLRKR